MKMLEVKEGSLEKLGEYLEVDTPVRAWVEDWEGFTNEGYDLVETLLVEWNNGNQLFSKECNQNLDILVNLIDYEE